MCSNTYLPLTVVSLIVVVLVVLTTPLTRNVATATMRTHATARATAISTRVIPPAGFFRRLRSSRRRKRFAGEAMGGHYVG